MDIIEHNRRVYNTIAKHFSATRSWIWDDLVPLKQYVKDGDQVLDLACGNGRLCLLLKDLSISYLGVDYSEALLQQAKEKFPNLEFIPGEMTAIPAKDKQFDVVFCLASFHHLPDRKARLKTLHEIARVLKPGGRLIMTNWNLYSEWAREKLATPPMSGGPAQGGKNAKWKLGTNEKEYIVPWKSPEGEVIGDRYYYAYTPEELEKMLVEAGLAVEKQYYAAKRGAKDMSAGQNLVTIAKNVDNRGKKR